MTTLDNQTLLLIFLKEIRKLKKYIYKKHKELKLYLQNLKFEQKKITEYTFKKTETVIKTVIPQVPKAKIGLPKVEYINELKENPLFLKLKEKYGG